MNTVLHVNESLFLENVEKIQKYIGNKKIMPVVKAHGYGTYIHQRIELLNLFSIVAVANVKEAFEIRKLGYEKDIFVLNQPLIEDLEIISKENIVIGLSEIEFLKKVNFPIRVHIELETGMNRTGVKLKNLNSFIEEVKQNTNITVEGCYTHFSSADFDPEYTKKQISFFEEGVSILQKYFSLKYIHSSASSGLHYIDAVSNYVRPGILLYGHQPSSSFVDVDVKPITTFQTKIVSIKEVQKGEAISYGQTFIAEDTMKIATISVGYGDGYSRGLSNKGFVLIDGKKCQIVGRVCMDSCMVDVTGLDVYVGEDVLLWDNLQISVEEIANTLDTISYEVLCGISSRVERKFFK